MKDDSVYLNHIGNCIARIQENTAQGYEEFIASHTLQDAVLRNLQVLAESTQHLSETVKAMQPAVEWAEIGAFRNVLVHDYLGIDLDAIWDISQKDLPKLAQAVKAILHRLSGRGNSHERL